jgi:hypothetical protein
MRIINDNKAKGIPVPINNTIYFIPIEYLNEMSMISGADWKDMAIIVERIRRDCSGYAYKS